MIVLISIIFYFILQIGSESRTKSLFFQELLKKISRHETILLFTYFAVISYVSIDNWKNFLIEVSGFEIIKFLPFFGAAILYENFFKLPSSTQRVVRFILSIMISQFSWKASIFAYLFFEIFEKKELWKIKSLLLSGCLVSVFKNLEFSEFSIFVLLVIFLIEIINFKKSTSSELPLPLFLFFLIEKSNIFHFKLVVLVSMILCCLVVLKKSTDVNWLEKEKIFLFLAYYLAILGFEVVAMQLLLLPIMYYVFNSSKVSKVIQIIFFIIYFTISFFIINLIFEDRAIGSVILSIPAVLPLVIILERILKADSLKEVNEFNYFEISCFFVIISLSPIITRQLVILPFNLVQFIFTLSFFAMVAFMFFIARVAHENLADRICRFNILLSNKLKF